MPTYLYVCPKHGEFEEYHSIVIKLETCPQCQATDGYAQPIERLIGGGGSGRGIVELSGQDLVDHVKQDAKRIQSEASRDVHKYANLLGEAKYSALQERMDKQKRR